MKHKIFFILLFINLFGYSQIIYDSCIESIYDTIKINFEYNGFKDELNGIVMIKRDSILYAMSMKSFGGREILGYRDLTDTGSVILINPDLSDSLLLTWTIYHEIGHHIGLKHDTSRFNMMQPELFYPTDDEMSLLVFEFFMLLKYRKFVNSKD